MLEDIDNYNTLYAITEIYTSDPEAHKQRGLFSMGGNTYNVEFGGWVRHSTQGFQNATI